MEDLTGGSGALGAALQAAILLPLEGSSHAASSSAQSASEAWGQNPRYLVYGYLEPAAKVFHMSLDIEDVAAQSLLPPLECTGSAEDCLDRLPRELAGALRIAPRTAAIPSQTLLTLSSAEILSRGSAPDNAAIRELFRKAWAADPNSGLAPLSYAAWLNRIGEPRESRAVLERAMRSPIPDLERRKVALLLATDPKSRVDALSALAAAAPADTALQLQAANALVGQRRFPEAAAATRAALRVDGENPEIWKALAYIAAWEGKSEEARDAAANAVRLSKHGLGYVEAAGDIAYYDGRFTEAEAAYRTVGESEQGQINGLAYVKAADCRLWLGDVAQADSWISRYFAIRAAMKDVSLPLQRALWDQRAGRREKARKDLATAPATPEMQRLLLWLAALDGDAKAVRAISSMPQPPALQGAAMLLANHPALAVEQLVHLRPLMFPFAEGRLADLLAVALFDAGRKEEARQTLTGYGLPSGPEDVLALVAFPRIKQVRAALAKMQ